MTMSPAFGDQIGQGETAIESSLIKYDTTEEALFKVSVLIHLLWWLELAFQVVEFMSLAATAGAWMTCQLWCDEEAEASYLIGALFLATKK